MSTPHPNGAPARARYPLARPFPQPGRLLAQAYADLDTALNGDAKQRRGLGSIHRLPRPWDPGSIQDPPMRAELWQWLEAVVEWINTEHVWDPAYLIPECWPSHPHLVHELAVLADQRRRAGAALTSDALEEWHRYALPAFFDRRRTRLRNMCDDNGHRPWPAEPAHTRYLTSRDYRAQHFAGDVDHQRLQHQARTAPATAHRLQVIDGHHVDPTTGEVH